MAKSNTMGLTLALWFLVFSIASNAQKKQYNTRVDSAGKVIINSGTTTILKADSVFIGQVIVNPRDMLEFLGAVSQIDSNGVYTTTYKFTSKNHSITFDAKVRIEFNRPIIPWYSLTDTTFITNMHLQKAYFVVGFKGVGSDGEERVSEDLKTIVLKEVFQADYFTITVASKEKLDATITLF